MVGIDCSFTFAKKFLLMRPLYLIFAIFLVTVFSCNNAPTPTAHAKIVPQSSLGDEGTQLLMGVMSKYYVLKNGLVATKAGRSDSAAAELVTATNSFQSFLQKDSTKMTSLKPYLDTIEAESKTIASTTDESCERQRLAFGPLSSALFGLLEKVDLKHGGVYRAYCPMAFNDKGAHWLTEENEIKNPYFGKKMMECGEVTDSL